VIILQEEIKKYISMLIFSIAIITSFCTSYKKKFKITWFNHDTKIVDLDAFNNLFDKEKDFIVLPEDLGSDILSFLGKK